MNDLEQRLQRALDTVAAELPISEDPWPQQRQLIGRHSTLSWRDRRWVWVGLTAIATCVLLLVVLVLVPSLRGSDNGAPPAVTTPGPTPDPTRSFAKRYFQRCLADARSLGSSASTAGAVLRLVASDRYGQVAVITTPTAISVCQVDEQGRLRGGQVRPWLNGNPHAITFVLTDEWHSHWYPQAHVEWVNYNIDAGRVSSDVARVVYTAPGHPPIEAAVGGGVFVLRYVPEPYDSLRAYDSGGRLIYDESRRAVPGHIPWP